MRENTVHIGMLDRRIIIEKKVVTQDPDYGTEVVTWATLATVWANVQDVLPSRSEAVQRGLEIARNQTRIRFRYRSDVTSAMRITLLDGTGRVLQIVGGPAELGRHEYTEVVCEAYSS